MQSWAHLSKKNEHESSSFELQARLATSLATPDSRVPTAADLVFVTNQDKNVSRSQVEL